MPRRAAQSTFARPLPRHVVWLTLIAGAFGAWLAGYPLELTQEGNALVYTFDAQHEHTGIADLLRQLDRHGIDFKDLRSRESSLEEIFVSLVREQS